MMNDTQSQNVRIKMYSECANTDVRFLRYNWNGEGLQEINRQK